MLARLAKPETRTRIESEMNDRVSGNGMDWSQIRLAYVPSATNNHLEGQFIDSIAADRGETPEHVVVDLVDEEHGVICAVAHNSATDSDFENLMRHPNHICSTDAVLTGGSPHPRTFGTYPRFLGRFVRDRQALPLAEMIRHMTAAPAQRFGLVDRGMIRPGLAADLVVIDLPKVTSKATFDQPVQFPDGIDMVVVNGSIVIDHGSHTGATPGRGLRRGAGVQP